MHVLPEFLTEKLVQPYQPIPFQAHKMTFSLIPVGTKRHSDIIGCTRPPFQVFGHIITRNRFPFDFPTLKCRDYLGTITEVLLYFMKAVLRNGLCISIPQAV